MDQVAPYAAAALCALWAGVHIIMGGREIEQPLRRDRHHPDAVRGPAVMVWHMVSVTLVFMAGLFAVGGLSRDDGLVWAGIVLAAAYCLVGLLSAVRLGIGFGVMPQGWLFVPVVGLGLLAVL